MNTKTLLKSEALEYCTRQESHYFDRKAFEIQPAKVLKHAVAFANADGGEIVIGITDSKAEPEPEKRWKGKATIEDYNGHLQAIALIKPSLPFHFGFYVCKDFPGFVLHLEIDKSSTLHQCPDGSIYERVSAQSLPVTAPDRIMAITYSKGSTSYEDQVVPNSKIENIVDAEPIKTFLNDFSPKTDPLDFVVNQHLTDVSTWIPKVSGLLLFSRNPSEIIPKQCAIKIARYETREDEPERDHLKETFTIEGHLYQQIQDAANKISDIMSSISIWTIDGLKPLKYPPEAIWEVLVNAAIHRDYSISDNIQVHIYNNRIEILSPGKLPGYVTLENILESRFSRNPRIVRTLNRYKNAPNKDMGEGLNTTFQKMKEWRLQPPKISEEGNYVRVLIPHTPLASPEEAVLEFLNNNESITNSQARDLTGIRSENAMKSVFYKLRDNNNIERVPGLEGASAAWRKRV
jgi:ATP-dependent DNA helicase RecG